MRPAVEVTPDELEEMAKNSGRTIDMGGEVDRLTLPDGRRYFAVRVPVPARGGRA